MRVNEVSHTPMITFHLIRASYPHCLSIADAGCHMIDIRSPSRRSLKYKPSILDQKSEDTAALVYDMHHAFCAESMALYARYGNPFTEYGLDLIAVADVDAQLVIFRIHAQRNKAFILVGNSFARMYGVFQGV